jgi:hypothetical protein
MSEILIGITGRLGTGKSTLAEMLAQQIPDARVVAFADALKDAVTTMLARRILVREDALRAWLDDHKSDVFGPMLQGFGEFARLQCGQDFWIEQLAESLPDRAIVADVRHHNEAEWIRSRGGLLVVIGGPCRRPGDTRSAEHPSERHVEAIAAGADVRVINGGDLDWLRTEARRIARMALARAGEGVRPI